MESHSAWGTDVRIVVTTRLLGVNTAMYNEHDSHYCVNGPWLVDPAQSMDSTNRTIYVTFTGNHFDIILSQE